MWNTRVILSRATYFEVDPNSFHSVSALRDANTPTETRAFCKLNKERRGWLVGVVNKCDLLRIRTAQAQHGWGWGDAHALATTTTTCSNGDELSAFLLAEQSREATVSQSLWKAKRAEREIRRVCWRRSTRAQSCYRGKRGSSGRDLSMEGEQRGSGAWSQLRHASSPCREKTPRSSNQVSSINEPGTSWTLVLYSLITGGWYGSPTFLPHAQQLKGRRRFM